MHSLCCHWIHAGVSIIIIMHCEYQNSVNDVELGILKIDNRNVRCTCQPLKLMEILFAETLAMDCRSIDVHHLVILHNAPINIKPHYPTGKGAWGLIGDLTPFDLKNRPEGCMGHLTLTFHGHRNTFNVLYRSNPLFIPMVEVGI